MEFPEERLGLSLLNSSLQDTTESPNFVCSPKGICTSLLVSALTIKEPTVRQEIFNFLGYNRQEALRKLTAKFDALRFREELAPTNDGQQSELTSGDYVYRNPVEFPASTSTVVAFTSGDFERMYRPRGHYTSKYEKEYWTLVTDFLVRILDPVSNSDQRECYALLSDHWTETDCRKTLEKIHVQPVVIFPWSEDASARAKQVAIYVNNWVAEETQQRTTRAIESFPDDIHSALTTSFTVNGTWHIPYTAGRMNFHLTPSQRVSVDSLEIIGNLPIFSTHQPLATAVVLPYYLDDLKLVVQIPTGGYTIEDILREIAENTCWDILRNLSQIPLLKIRVSLPKFSVSSRVKPKDVLMTLGVRKAFCQKEGLCLKYSREEVSIREVEQRAEVQMTSNGLADARRLYSLRSIKGNLAIDKPFVFSIVDTKLEQVLFMGYVSDPRV